MLAGVALTLAVTAVCRAEKGERKVIENGNSVSIEYILKLDDGTTVDSNVGQDPLTYTQGKGEILPALEEALLGQAIGDTSEVALTAEQGYGPRNPEAFQEVAKDSVPEEARTAGMMLMATTTEGQQIPVRVQEIKDETVVLDFNHPLAGQALNFEVKVVGIDEAPAETAE
jgi:FKBP-type peptidyl-prolyl cis-trans isomerase SlyD